VILLGKKNIFGVDTSIKKSSHALVVGELSLFKRLFVIPTTCVNPIVWWHNHETQFLNIGFLAKQILGILKSQIEVECVFNFVYV
jgi:hypothetical protein